VIGDANGIPLVVCTTPANVPDHVPLEDMVESMPPVRMPRGRPRYKPGALVGDRGYGFARTIAAVAAMRIKSLLSPRGKDRPHGSGLGKVRYVIERTLSWVGNYRRLKACYERTGEHWQAFNELACCLVCANRIARLRAAGKMAA
jgi:transposase